MSVFVVIAAIVSYLAVAVVVLASTRPDYSHVRDTISQLGERGAVRAKFAGRGVFLPVGLGLWAIGARLLWHETHDAHHVHVALLAFCIGTGYAVGGAFPCDPGFPRHGSWRQTIHDAGGLVEYVGGAYAIYRLLPIDGPVFVLGLAATAAVLLAGPSAFIPGIKRLRGLIQRAAEGILFGALLVAVHALDTA